MADKFTNSPWDGSSSRFTPEQWARSCILHMKEPDSQTKGDHKLPVREPDGTVNTNAMHAAAGAHGLQGVDAPPAAKMAAAKELMALYNAAGEQCPPAVTAMAGKSAAPALEHKSGPGYGLKVVDEAQGIVEMYVSVFNNTDYGGDIVRAGFFDKAAARKLPKGVWSHDPTIPIAKTLQTEPHYAGDPRLPEKIKQWGGQYVKGQFNLETQAGRDAFSNIKGGYIDEFSFAYLPGEVNYLDDGRRELKVADDWPEWSPVLQGMNPLTALVSAKSMEGGEGDTLPFADDLAAVVDAVRRVTERAKARQELRLKVGRRLSTASTTSLQEIRQAMSDCCDMLDAFMAEEQSEPNEPPSAVDAGMGKQWQEAMLRQIDSRLEQLALMQRR